LFQVQPWNQRWEYAQWFRFKGCGEWQSGAVFSVLMTFFNNLMALMVDRQ